MRVTAPLGAGLRADAPTFCDFLNVIPMKTWTTNPFPSASLRAFAPLRFTFFAGGYRGRPPQACARSLRRASASSAWTLKRSAASASR